MIRLAEWSDAAFSELSRVENLDMSETERNVRAGISQLWECEDNGLRGFVVTRLCRSGALVEWYWVACAGSGFMRFAPEFLAVAKAARIPVYVMVYNAGMRRLYHRLGFEDYSHTLRAA